MRRLVRVTYAGTPDSCIMSDLTAWYKEKKFDWDIKHKSSISIQYTPSQSSTLEIENRLKNDFNRFNTRKNPNADLIFMDHWL